ncbi:MerR family transcriptional regulator [Pleomorphomonas sp. JP5]|uniref:MerR family transcriptional regulator n=1 Tax=Pleomorphomonas sp. JP5 TaxID=2942998 RepID=UPI0028801123|nr:MerR family transcriptional regulator [Pleomorphomonas sp. JP5]
MLGSDTCVRVKGLSMQIGELSRRTGVSVRMLRHYEAKGLISPERTASGYRAFTVADVAVVRRIVVLSEAGLTLSSIRALLPCARGALSGEAPCPAFRAGVRAKIADIDAKMDALAESRRILSEWA